MNLSKRNQHTIECYKKGYRIIDGKIFNPQGKELKVMRDNSGYAKISSYSNGKYKNLFLHKLAAYQKFGELMFQEKIQVRHLDGDRLDFSLENIELGTAMQNRLDMPLEQRKDSAYRSNIKRRKLSQQEVEKIRNDFLNVESKYGFYSKIARLYNVSARVIWGIVHFETYNK